jgi:hypothetical protein
MVWISAAVVVLVAWSIGLAKLAYRRGYSAGQQGGMDAAYSLLDRSRSR